jgi:hypothetical protein
MWPLAATAAADIDAAVDVIEAPEPPETRRA